MLEAKKRLGDFLDRVKDLKEQEMGDGGEVGEDVNPGPHFSNPKNPYIPTRKLLEVIAETTTPTDEGGEETITEDLEVTPAVSEDCSERADLEDSFVLDEGALEEDRPGRTAQDDRYWDLLVRRGDLVKTVREKRESWISPETRKLLASKAAVLHTRSRN